MFSAFIGCSMPKIVFTLRVWLLLISHLDVVMWRDSPVTRLPEPGFLAKNESLPALEPVGLCHTSEPHIRMDCRVGEDSISVE